jgi:predicted dehydrogenase
MASVLKSAVIGTGAISKEHLSFLAQCDRAHLVGVCDLSPTAANYAAQKFKADAAYTDYRQMLEAAKPDVVHILTPPSSHKAIAIDCLKAGAHVFCEKPITPIYSEFKDLWEIAQSCDRHLIEDHNYRFNETIQAIVNLFADGILGKIEEVEVRMALNIRDENGRYGDENLPNPMHKLPAGIIHDFISHLCYLTLLFLPDFDRVGVAWSNHGGGDLFKYDDLDAIVIGGSTHARIRFSSYTQPECFTITVRGSKGFAETDIFQPYLRCVRPRQGGKQLSPLINLFVNGYELMNASARILRDKLMQKGPYEGLHRLLDLTYEALANGSQPPISFADMERTNRLIEALLAKENQV